MAYAEAAERASNLCTNWTALVAELPTRARGDREHETRKECRERIHNAVTAISHLTREGARAKMTERCARARANDEARWVDPVSEVQQSGFDIEGTLMEGASTP